MAITRSMAAKQTEGKVGIVLDGGDSLVNDQSDTSQPQPNEFKNLTSTGAQETLFAVENASEHATKGGEGDVVQIADLDKIKVENNDSNIGCVSAYNTNAKVTEGSSKSNNHGGHRRGKKRDASEHTTKGGEADAVLTNLVNSTAGLYEFAADLDEIKVENNDSNIGRCVDASKTNAKVTEGSSKTKSKNHGGYRSGNKKDGPATNVPAERRRRAKLNKYLRELRSVVPKISTMSQTSVLEDAIDYMKELRQKISELERELELLPPVATPPVATGFSQLTPNAATIPSCSTKDLAPIREPARVDVQQMKNGVLDIHILCSPKPDLLYLISKTLEDLSLTIQDATIANFDVFKLDLLAQQNNEGQCVKPDQIKAILLDLVGDGGAPEV